MELTPKPINLDKLPPIELVRDVLEISDGRKLYHYHLNLLNLIEAKAETHPPKPAESPDSDQNKL